MTKRSSLSLAMPNPIPTAGSPSTRSPVSHGDSKHSSPLNAVRDGAGASERHHQMNEDESSIEKQAENAPFNGATTEPHSESNTPCSPTFTSLPPFPTDPRSTPKHVRDQSKSFFSNLKASKSNTKIQSPDSTIRQVPHEATEAVISTEKLPTANHFRGESTPDLSMLAGEIHTREGKPHSYAIPRRPVGTPTVSDTALVTELSGGLATKKSKSKFPPFLQRSPSMRMGSNDGKRSKPSTPIKTKAPELEIPSASGASGGLKSAPIQEKGPTFRDLMGSTNRNRSADRQPSPHSDHGDLPRRRGNRSKDRNHGLSGSTSQVFRSDGAGGHLLSGLRSTTNKAAEGLGKAGRGIMGKMTRSGSSTGREVINDNDYQCHIITLPLAEQTRVTRIAKRLEDSKDKTEFWMPSLPWRCIDFLNFRGCDEEGLYRIPGSGREVKYWQRRFDQELDINLFDEPELFDVNIIGSMFKQWLRELPDSILPKEIQDRVGTACAGQTSAPQMLKDELSMLPPWNYYLLFAITCHLSLLVAYVDKNKMSYGNLAICFSPCLKISGDCFQWLVCDWRNCWQGCWTEKEALEQEYCIIDGVPFNQNAIDDSLPASRAGADNSRGGDSSGDSTAVETERSISSSGSSKQTARPAPLDLGNQNSAAGGNHNRSASQLPELSLAPPLSPLGL